MGGGFGLGRATGLAAAALAWIAAGALRAETDWLRIDGSSTLYPLTEAVAEEFQLWARGRFRVTVAISGTGGGFRRLCRGEADLVNASRPIRPEEERACAAAGVRPLAVPVALDAVTVVVHPANDWVDCLSVDELGRMWAPAAQGRLTRWSQLRPTWPDIPLALYGPGPDSGTYDYFTAAVVGKAGASRGDYTASEDDNVLVLGVSRDPGALGFFGYPYYAQNRDRLKAVAVRDPETGACRTPSPDNVQANRYRPLARLLWLYVDAGALEEREAVRAFLAMYLDP